MWVAEMISRTGRSATGASACGLELKRRRAGPGAFHDDVLKPVVDQLQDARAAVDVRNDLQEIIRLSRPCANRGVRSSALCLKPMVPVATRTGP